MQVRATSPGLLSFPSTFHQHLPIKLCAIASLRSGSRKDGSTYVQVLYRLDGKQTSTSFEDMASAARFQKLASKFGPAKALETIGTDPELCALTVEKWLEHHVEHLTGLRKSTLYDYRSYMKNDIAPVLGELALTALTRDDIARWTQSMEEGGAAGTTIANKHGFLSSALNAAVRAGHIPSNPAAGQRMPTSERPDMICRRRPGCLCRIRDGYRFMNDRDGDR